jgi:hypothetical protein
MPRSSNLQVLCGCDFPAPRQQILAALVIGPAFQLAQLPFTILKF